ncbi:hypothetical protein [Kribbella sp. HUAS MG21]|uniref:Uncharacterized protein n=1 Tax=Kribbella sp. HUAS MG21 TaxID=3160966 RepID=A0AAU7T5C2_9ACTN
MIDGRFERTDQLAGDWIRRLDNALGRSHRFDVRNLYRWTGPDRRSVAHADGSITLNQETALWMSVVGDRLYNAHYQGEFPPPARRELASIRAALADFGDTYLDAVQPQDRTAGPAARALDAGVRANTVDISGILDGMYGLSGVYPGIEQLEGPDRQPLLQGAAAALTEQLSRRVGMRPGEFDAMLRQTPAAQRFDVLADHLIAKDPQQPRLPDGSPRRLPADHLDRLKALLAHELETTFQDLSEQDPQGSRQAGRAAVERAVRNIARRTADFRETIQTDQRGYAQVASLMSTVQTALSTSRASTAAGRESGALTLHRKPRTSYWSGELRESVDTPGAAGPDRSLTFDRDRVIAVLAAVDPSQPPSQAFRSAVHTVAARAARLCNPEGAVPADDVGQALEDALTRDFAAQPGAAPSLRPGLRIPTPSSG